jgi:hypothetical protein
MEQMVLFFRLLAVVLVVEGLVLQLLSAVVLVGEVAEQVLLAQTLI